MLEISTKSASRLGKSLSAFNLTLGTGAKGSLSVEAAFQGSKVFEQGGPYQDLYELSGRQIKKDDRLKNSGRLKGFNFMGDTWPLEPKTAFYDWLYMRALRQHPTLASAVGKYAAFSDIEFNPRKSINCQARSVALFVALRDQQLLDEAVSDRSSFVQMFDMDSGTGTLFPV